MSKEIEKSVYQSNGAFLKTLTINYIIKLVFF